MGRPKITVVGAGNVGGTTAQRLAEKDEYEVVLVDIVEGVPQGKALDITQAGPVCGYGTRVVGTNGYDETAGSAVAVITSGIPRKPGMSRDELLATNAKIVKSVVSELVSRSPNVILILVTNPLDAMVHVARLVSGLPKARVLGMAGVLDSARMRAFIAADLSVPGPDVDAMVLGAWGYDGASVALYDGEGEACVRADVEGAVGGDREADSRRGRRNRRPLKDRQRVLCPVGFGCRHGRGDHEGSEAGVALCGALRRRIWIEGCRGRGAG